MTRLLRREPETRRCLDLKRITAALVLFLMLAGVLSSCSAMDRDAKMLTEENLRGRYTLSDGLQVAVYFYETDGGATMQLCRTDDKGRDVAFQKISFPQQNEYYASLDFFYAKDYFDFTDMNFDGLEDLYVPCSVTTENLECMCWIRKSGEDYFELSEDLSRLPEPVALPKQLRIRSCDNSTGERVSTLYWWNNGRLVPEGKA